MTDPQASAQERPLPCPHCGGEAICDPWPAGNQTYYKVLCRSVITCCASGGAFPSPAQAIAAWNRRAAVSSASAMEVLEELVSIQDLKRKHAIACYMANTQVGQLQRDGLAEVDRIATELAKIEKPTWDRARALLSQAKERNISREQ